MWRYVKDIWNDFKCCLGLVPAPNVQPDSDILLRGTEHMRIAFTCTDTATIHIGGHSDAYPAGTHSVTLNHTDGKDVYISGTVTALTIMQNVSYVSYSRYLVTLTLAYGSDVQTIDARNATMQQSYHISTPATTAVSLIYSPSGLGNIDGELKRVIERSTVPGELYIRRDNPPLVQSAINKGWRIYAL